MANNSKKILQELLSSLRQADKTLNRIVPEVVIVLEEFLKGTTDEFFTSDLQNYLEKKYALSIKDLHAAACSTGKLALEKYLDNLLKDEEAPVLASEEVSAPASQREGISVGFFAPSAGMGFSQEDWIKKIAEMGVDEAVLAELQTHKMISSYENLYQRLRLFVLSMVGNLAVHSVLQGMEVWELCCLSGELKAIAKAEADYGLNSKFYKKVGLPLHIALMSGNRAAVSHMLVKYEAEYEHGHESSPLAIKYAVTVSFFEYGLQELAVLGGNPELLERAIELEGGEVIMDRPHPLSRDLNGFHIGHMATLNGSEVIMNYVAKLAREGRFELLRPSDRKVTVLHTAAMSGKVEVLKMALKWVDEPEQFFSQEVNDYYKAEDDLESRRSRLRLHYFGNVDSIRCRDEHCRSLLHFAAWGGGLEMCDYLISLGLSRFDLDNDGERLSWYAACGGNTLLVDDLVEKKGLDPTITKNYGDTILHKVAYKGDLEMCKHLISKHGMSVSARNADNLRPRDMLALGSSALGWDRAKFDDSCFAEAETPSLTRS